MSSIDAALIKAFGQQDVASEANSQPGDAREMPGPLPDRATEAVAVRPHGLEPSPSAEPSEAACCGCGGGECTGCDTAACSGCANAGCPQHPGNAQAERPAGSPEPEAASATPAEPATAEESSAGERAQSLAADSASSEEPFQPSFQVDSFAWPSGCTRLSMAAGESIDQLAEALRGQAAEGRRVMAMSGCRRGDGCTTLLLCVARRLAEQGLRVAMVDADFDNPLLARRLGLLPEVGWEEVFTARRPIQDVIIESVHDRLALLPLCGSLPCGACPADGVPDAAAALHPLREHYDLVLVDLGEFTDDPAGGTGVAHAVIDWIDAAVLVHNVRATTEEERNRTRRRARAAGLAEAGVAENFAELRKSA